MKWNFLGKIETRPDPTTEEQLDPSGSIRIFWTVGLILNPKIKNQSIAGRLNSTLEHP